MTVAKALEDGRSLPTRIGACRSCGKWFNEAGLLELPPYAEPGDSPEPD
jgi:hypothetical protein